MEHTRVPRRGEHALRVLQMHRRRWALAEGGGGLVHVVDLQRLVHVAKDAPWHPGNEVVVVNHTPQRGVNALTLGCTHGGLNEGQVPHARLSEGPHGVNVDTLAGAQVHGRQRREARAQRVPGKGNTAAVEAVDGSEHIVPELLVGGRVAGQDSAAGAPGGTASGPGRPPDEGVRQRVPQVVVRGATEGADASSARAAAGDPRDVALDIEDAPGAQEARPRQRSCRSARAPAPPRLDPLSAAEGDARILRVDQGRGFIVGGTRTDGGRHGARRSAEPRWEWATRRRAAEALRPNAA
mmetsp:Transcript_60259/g.186515  ORF Transcript_60259/g.186515 Transcript_60259/m.186515 type:complete len:296 (+) Transcript_60259:109-996(+)